MNKKNSKESIFPDKMPVCTDETNVNIMNEIENLSSRMNLETEHVLSQGVRNEDFQRNDITYLVKAGHPLPEVKSPEEMLVEDVKRNETKENQEQSPYRMVNLIANSFRLPEIESEDFLK